jgi:hypothetical protein
VRPYTRHQAICGAPNVIGGQPLQTWPGIPAAPGAIRGFLQFGRSGEKLEMRGTRPIRVSHIASNRSVTRPLDLSPLSPSPGPVVRETKRRAIHARALL